MPKSKKNIRRKKKNKASTKKNRNKNTTTNLATIYKHHEFGGTYPVISGTKYSALKRIDNLNLPSDFPSNSPLKDFLKKELIRRLMAYLKFKKHQKTLYNTLKIKYNKKDIESKLLQFSNKSSNLKKLEKIYISILSSK